MIDTIVLSAALLIIAVVLHADAPRQVRRLLARPTQQPRPRTDAGRAALQAELVSRLRLAAVGNGVGTVLAAVPLLARGGGPEGPDGLAVVATLLSSTVVTGVVTETVTVLRRTPPRPDGPRTAALSARSAHTGPAESALEILLALLGTGALALGIACLVRELGGAAGAIGSAVGALVVIAACALTRARLVHRPVVARDTDDLAVDAAAGAATADRLSENLVASGGVLTLAALLVPAIAGPGWPRNVALILALVTAATMVALVVLRRIRGQEVHA